jgi:hypothetical protein
MVVEVVLCLQKLLCLRSAEVELDPLLVDGLRDPLCFDASLVQPGLDSIDALLGRCEDLMNVFSRVVLSIRLGVRVGAVRSMVSSPSNAQCSWELFNSHLHEKLVAFVQVALHQTNPHGELDIAVHAITLDPILRRLSAFVQDMALEVDSRGSDCRGSKSRKSGE